MKMHKLINRYTLATALLCLGVLNSTTTTASPLTLSDTPLFLKSTAKSNLFFLFDNTRSMEDETITSNQDGAQVFTYGVESGTANSDLTKQTYVDICTGVGCTTNSFGTSPQKFRAPSYNTLYYDNTKTYDQWPKSTPSECTFTHAVIDPTNPSSKYVDLSADWGTSNLAVDSTAGYYASYSASTGVGTFKPIPDTSLTAAEQTQQEQNYANWFCYHRTRMLAAKSAVLNVINKIPANVPIRIGINTFKNDNFIGLKDITAKDLNDSTDPGVVERNDMITKIKPWEFCGFGDYGTGTCASGTNTFATLTRAGHYFKCDSSTYTMGASGSPTGATTGACAYTSTVIPTDEQSCAANFVAIVTDGEFGDTGTSTADNSTTGTNPTNSTDPSFVTDVHQSTVSDTLADLAMSLYDADFSSTIDNKVPITCGVDENAGQHLVTFAVSMGLPYDITAPSKQPRLGIAPNCTPSTSTEITNLENEVSGSSSDSSNRWKETSGQSTDYKINQMVHAAYNGRGKFFNATSASDLTDNLLAIANDAISRRGAAATAGFSSTSNDSGTLAFVSSFYSGGWYGDLVADEFNSDGSLTEVWSAADILDKLSNSEVKSTGTGRTIVTYANGTGQPFDWSHISTDQQDDLRTADDGTTDSVTIGGYRLEYIRGDHTCEASSAATSGSCADKQAFRPRTKAGDNTRLGDMVNSAPVYVGEPIGNFPNTAPFPTGTDSYQSFQTNEASRKPMVYIGGNDGMLHGFRATYDTSVTPNYDGKEIFAYIPSVLSSGAKGSTTTGLHKLTETGAHRAYVDLTPSVADAYTTTPSDSSNRVWRTILVGGLRSGGKGVFAIDVTDPVSDITDEATASKKIMWEFTSADDADLGYTYSQPVIVPLRVKTGSTTPTDDIEWFAVFGNGYNSTKGHAVLFLLKLSGPGTDGTWDLNTDYYKIDTKEGTSADPNGLSSPAVIDNNGDGIYDRVYAGDLEGNMWAFDLSSSTPSGWKSAYGTSAAPKAFFTASSASNTTQPITTKPLVIRNKASNSGHLPNVLVLFGTGSYLADGDQSNTDGQTYYAVWDSGVVLDSSNNPITPLTRSNLLAKSLATSPSTNYRIIDPAKNDIPDYSSTTELGWYLDLPDTGERVISRSFLIGSNVFFSTIVPSSTSCSGGGSSWLMAVDPTTGKSPGIPTFDYTNNGVIDASDIPDTSKPDGPQFAGMKTDSLIPQYAFLVNKATTTGSTKPLCSQGTAVVGIGTTSEANVISQGLCAGGGNAKAGRYSWRQLDFK